MTTQLQHVATTVFMGAIITATGCAQKRVHVLPEIEEINRVAVINLGNRGDKAATESEFFTNEFVSVGFSVVERGHLQDVIKEAFTQTGYLDERSVAEWGRGLGIEGVVLHQLLTNAAARKGEGDFEVTGWVRLVDVETGKIVMSYNAEVMAPANGNSARAAKFYAEKVVDDIRETLKQKSIRPGAKVKIVTKQVQVQLQTSPPPATQP